MPSATGNPGEFDYFLRGAPLAAQRGKLTLAELDYFLRGEPSLSIDYFVATPTVPFAGSASSSTASLTLTGPTTIPLDVSASQSAANATITTPGPTLVPLAASASQSATSAAVAATGAVPVFLVFGAPGTPSPNELSYFRQGEPSQDLQGRRGSAEFDYWRRREPLRTLTLLSVPAAASVSSTTLAFPTSFIPDSCASSSATTLALLVESTLAIDPCSSVSIAGAFSEGLLMSPLTFMDPALLMQGAIWSDLTLIVPAVDPLVFIRLPGLVHPRQVAGVA